MSFRLTILGTSSALPTSDRYPTAHVLNVHERLYLIDCGEGTQMQMRKYHIRFGKINNIFISHLHGDHIFGLYGLLSTLNLTGRKEPVSIYAPEPFEDIIRRHLEDFDINLAFDLTITHLGGRSLRQIMSDKRLTVYSFPLKHRVPAYGFLFREKKSERKITLETIREFMLSYSEIALLKRGEDVRRDDGTVLRCNDLTLSPPGERSYAYCSDTSYFRKLASFVRGVDLLFHEATFGDEYISLAKQTGHSTAGQAAMVARDSEAGRLLIGHFSARYKSPDLLEEEAKKIFPATEAAREGETYDVELKAVSKE